MNWTEKQITNIVTELAEENPLACRALLSIVSIRYTPEVNTLAVTLSSRPELLINKEFCDRHMNSEDDVKAVLLHEFLHVLLGHTEKYKFSDTLVNIATDAVINSIIHRKYGTIYSGFFQRLYNGGGLKRLLRPDFFSKCEDPKSKCPAGEPEGLKEVHSKIYSGQICADDLEELLEFLMRNRNLNQKDASGIPLIGNHGKREKVSKENGKLLGDILNKVDAREIWPNRGRGTGDESEFEARLIENHRITSWRKDTFSVLRKCLTIDPHKKPVRENSDVVIPVMNSGDRRALSKFHAFGYIPFARNSFSREVTGESTDIYLDVSGSMIAEIDQLITLLNSFRDKIKKPLWAFSDEVCPAVFRNGSLEFKTSGGTQIGCVFRHIREKKIKKCLIVTDGYVEEIDQKMLSGIDTAGISVIVSADGSANEFERHGIKHYQLKKI